MIDANFHVYPHEVYPAAVHAAPHPSDAAGFRFSKMLRNSSRCAPFLQNAGPRALWRIRTRHFGRPKSPKCPLKSPDCAAKAPECGADFSSPRTLPKWGSRLEQKPRFPQNARSILNCARAALEKRAPSLSAEKGLPLLGKGPLQM